MNPVCLFTTLTFITVIAAYFSALRLFEFGFTQKSWYKIVEWCLWIATGAVWIADIVFLKSYFTSDITLGAQFIIQIVLNAVLIFWPAAFRGLFVKCVRPDI